MALQHGPTSGLHWKIQCVHCIPNDTPRYEQCCPGLTPFYASTLYCVKIKLFWFWLLSGSTCHHLPVFWITDLSFFTKHVYVYVYKGTPHLSVWLKKLTSYTVQEYCTNADFCKLNVTTLVRNRRIHWGHRLWRTNSDRKVVRDILISQRRSSYRF
jgi:hypothetical protein